MKMNLEERRGSFVGYAFAAFAALFLAFLMVATAPVSTASADEPYQQAINAALAAAMRNVQPQQTHVDARAIGATDLGSAPSAADQWSNSSQNQTPAQVDPSDPTKQSYFSGGGSGYWNCDTGTLPTSPQSNMPLLTCPSIVTSTITWGLNKPPQYVGPHISEARKQCGAGETGGTSTNIGAHIKYKIVRSGQWRWDHQVGRPYINYSINTNTLVSVDCIDIGYTDRQEICMVSGLAVADKVIPNEKRVGARGTTTDWGAGNHSYQGCMNSQVVVANLGVSLTEPGRYILDAKVYGAAVTVRQWARNPITGVTPPPEIIKAGKNFLAGTGRNYAQITCKAAYTGAGPIKNAVWRGSGWTWTGSDCIDADQNTTPGQGTYQCEATDGSPLDRPKVNGVYARQADLFRNNESNRVSWANPRPTGPFIVSSTPKRTKVERSGTPWNSPKKFAAGSNNFRLETTNGINRIANNNGTNWLSGGVFNFDARANWASEAKAPTRLSTTWEYDVRMRIPSLTVNNIYINTTGNNTVFAVNWTAGMTNVNTTARCYGSSNLNFVRAVNDAS